MALLNTGVLPMPSHFGYEIFKNFNRKELRVEYAQSNTTILTYIINIMRVNIVVFDCAYSTRNSLPL